MNPLKKERALFFKNSLDRIQMTRPFTQEEIADVLGISLSFVNQICRQKRAPSYQTILLLEEKFNIEVPEHLSGVDPMVTRSDRANMRHETVGFDVINGTNIPISGGAQGPIHVYHHFDEESKAFLIELLSVIKD